MKKLSSAPPEEALKSITEIKEKFVVPLVGWRTDGAPSSPCGENLTYPGEPYFILFQRDAGVLKNEEKLSALDERIEKVKSRSSGKHVNIKVTNGVDSIHWYFPPL